MRTFTVFGALTLAGALTACAGSQSGPAFSPGTISARSTDGAHLPAVTPLERRDFMLGGEVKARGNHVLVHPDCPARAASFSVSGSASGPCPETFTASGSWTLARYDTTFTRRSASRSEKGE